MDANFVLIDAAGGDTDGVYLGSTVPTIYDGTSDVGTSLSTQFSDEFTGFTLLPRISRGLNGKVQY